MDTKRPSGQKLRTHAPYVKGPLVRDGRSSPENIAGWADRASRNSYGNHYIPRSDPERIEPDEGCR